MEVSFDTEKRGGSSAPATRLYAPVDKSSAEIRLYAEDETPVRPQPGKEKAAAKPKEKTPVYSYVLLILSVFMIAASAIFAIDGNARIAKIYSSINSLQSDIKAYEQDISMLKKEQSSLNDYNTINSANQEAGRVMNWPD